jgi:predicted transcriptional regulator YdeE
MMPPEFEVVHVAAFRWVGLTVTAPPAQLGRKIPEARVKLFERVKNWPAVTDPHITIGLTTPLGLRRRDGKVLTGIGHRVEDGRPPLGLASILVPEGAYARFSFVGSLATDEWTQFYPAALTALSEIGLDQTRPWMEEFDDATHDWRDKGRDTNQITVLLPVSSSLR